MKKNPSMVLAAQTNITWVTSVYLFKLYDTHFTSFDLVVYVVALPATVWISDQWRRALS